MRRQSYICFFEDLLQAVNIRRKSLPAVETIKRKLVRLVYDICSMRNQRITAFKKSAHHVRQWFRHKLRRHQTMARMGYSVSIGEYYRTRSNITLGARSAPGNIQYKTGLLSRSEFRYRTASATEVISV
jgi:hypothetical protein